MCGTNAKMEEEEEMIIVSVKHFEMSLNCQSIDVKSVIIVC